MGRVAQQKPSKQATGLSGSGVRGGKVAKQRKKHKIVLESSNNGSKDNDDQLRVVLSFHMEPPPGYTFIPAGNTQLTAAMKAFAKRDNHKVMAVSATPHAQRHELSREVHRVGYHFPTQVVDQVCSHYGIRLDSSGRLIGEHENEKLFMKISQKGQVVLNENIRDQVTINTEAKEIIRDLFPKIPDNDLFQIIKTAFQLGDNKVGTADEIPLVRRAQLSVVAHIRHVYTGYDKLLRQVPYNEARHIVEKATLKKLVEWRGDNGDKDEDRRKAVEDAVREVVVLSDEDESDSELEEGQVLENGDVKIEPVRRPAQQVLETNHRAVSPVDISSDEEAPKGYRFVPPVIRRRVRPEALPEIAARRQSRYASIWDQVRSEYRSELTLEEPSTRVVTRIPLDAPANTSADVLYRQPEFISREPLRAEELSQRHRLDNPQPQRLMRQPSPPLLFRGEDGRLYERVAPRTEQALMTLSPQRVYTPPTRAYVPAPQYSIRRSASPQTRPVLHRRTPSLNENDRTILPSIEGSDGIYQSPQGRRNPYDFPDRALRQPQRVVSDHIRQVRQPNLIDLTNSAEMANKRRRSSTPPSPYLRRGENLRPGASMADQQMMDVNRGQLIDLEAPTSSINAKPAFYSFERPTGAIRDRVQLEPSTLEQYQEPRRHALEYNNHAIVSNREVAPVYDSRRIIPEKRIVYEAIDAPRSDIRPVFSREASPTRYMRSSGQQNLARRYVSQPQDHMYMDIDPPLSSHAVTLVERGHPVYATSSTQPTRQLIELQPNQHYDPASRTVYTRQ